MSSKKHLLLIIDAQQDFCSPEGALYVPGADKDMNRLANFILHEIDHIDGIYITLDTHHVNDIAHPSFWIDAHGNHPKPFTQITAAEVKAGQWKARFAPDEALAYLEQLEAQGEYPHFIWPEHCLWGTKGNALYPSVAEACTIWARHRGKNYEVVVKGTHPLTEHFGVFRAQVPRADAPETQLNEAFLDALDAYDHLWVAGEAKSHCVATSLKQIMQYRPAMVKKLHIIEDCMSDVEGLGHLAKPIYEALRAQGAHFVKSSELSLKAV
jgi:nicotinamidase-related amidase